MHDEEKNFGSTISGAQTKNRARLEMLYDIGSVLASSETIGDVVPRILEAVCRALRYEAGEFWSFERAGKSLRLKTAWHSSPEAEVFFEESRKFEFSKGEGLPGQVWDAAAPVWIENLSEAVNFPRKDAALTVGFHSAFAFPVLPGEKFSGVFNFLSREIREPDEDLLNMFAAVGNIIGQFIKRENAEERFRESEARYRIVAETASDGLISIDEDSKILFANPATERIFGHKVEEVIGQKLTMLMPEYLRAVHEAGLARYVETGKRHLNWEHIEVAGLHANGYEFPLELSFGESNQNGKRVFIGIARDITERKIAQTILSESEERFAKAFNASPLILTISSLKNGRIIEVNDTFVEVSGFARQEAVGRTTLELGLWTNTTERTEELKTIKRVGKLRNVEYSFRNRSGEELIGLLSAERIEIGGESFALTVVQDITLRKQTEQALLERERLALLNSDVSFALIQNNSLQDILRACTEAVVKHLDAAFARVWTLNKESNMLELQTSSGMYIHLDGQHSHIPIGKYKIGLIAAERKPHLTNSVIGDARVSEQEWAKREQMVAFAGYPLVVEKHLVGVIAMFARRPLTLQTLEALASISNTIALGIERKQAEAERERLLENEKELRHEAEVASRAKDEFIAVVSHELRSPLNAMLGWTRILQNTPTDPQTTEHALDVIVRNARSQSKLIEDLLDSSRISRGELRLDMQPLELLPVIESAIELTTPIAQTKEISVSRRLEATANFITGDADRINQILDNLLSNAIKFTPPGGTVEIRLEREDNEAKITVTDSGQGVSEEFLPQIFKRFKQADPSDTRRHGGLGIGLSLARHLVELHSGRISAYSAGEGKGATFTVYLPLRTVAPIKGNPGSNGGEGMDNQGKLSGVWVLAVDDEADAREMVSFMLQINGAKVTSARSAVEALEILRSAGDRLPDLLLSDISMPNESGYALLEKIRALPSENGGQIPAIALTAFNRPEDRQAALEAGFQRHLGKPVEPDNLISAIIETANCKVNNKNIF
jgi:PAS domain S-box-containing protein